MSTTIEAIEAIIVEGGWRNYVLARVRDADGAEGYGEATLKQKEKSVAAAVVELGATIVGRDVGAIEAVFRDLFVRDHWRGGVVHNSAISGIETALWDLLGKRCGLPVWQLFGGRVHDGIRLYANGWFRASTRRPELLAAAEGTVGLGFGGLKWNPFLRDIETAVRPSQRRDALRRAAEEVHAVRAHVGSDVDLLVECHGLLDKEEALLLCEEIAPADPLLIEEPVHPSSIEDLSWLAARSRVPIAAGERWFTRWDVLSVLARTPLAVLQTDVCHSGGLAELKKVASLAEGAATRLAPHNSAGPVATIATAHVMLTCPNFLILETFHLDDAWGQGIVVGDHAIREGHLHLSEAPGLGIEPNESGLERRTMSIAST